MERHSCRGRDKGQDKSSENISNFLRIHGRAAFDPDFGDIEVHRMDAKGNQNKDMVFVLHNNNPMYAGKLELSLPTVLSLLIHQSLRDWHSSVGFDLVVWLRVTLPGTTGSKTEVLSVWLF